MIKVVAVLILLTTVSACASSPSPGPITQRQRPATLDEEIQQSAHAQIVAGPTPEVPLAYRAYVLTDFGLWAVDWQGHAVRVTQK